jgi:hypothetical protein
MFHGNMATYFAGGVTKDRNTKDSYFTLVRIGL